MGVRAEIQLKELKEPHREIAQVIGVENLIRLSEIYGGTTLYIPKPGEILKNRRYAALIEEFDGSNIKYLARKYHVSERTIYRLVKGIPISFREKPMEGQISFFGNEGEANEN